MRFQGYNLKTTNDWELAMATKNNFSNKHVTANGNTWTISGYVEHDVSGSAKVTITSQHGDVNDKESFEEAVQNFLIDNNYIH